MANAATEPLSKPLQHLHPEDHFAETITAYAMQRSHGFYIKINAQDKETYHLSAHLAGPEMAHGRTFSKAFLAAQSQPDLDQAT